MEHGHVTVVKTNDHRGVLVMRICACQGCSGHPDACPDKKMMPASTVKRMSVPTLCAKCSQKTRSYKSWSAYD